MRTTPFEILNKETDMANGHSGNQDGKGTSKTITTAEHDAEVRRAKKQKQRSRSGASGFSSDSFLAGLQQDREIERQEALARKQHQIYEFQCDQANMASSSDSITSLTPGTIARRVADAMLEAFPLAESFEEDGRQFSKTEAARRTAIATLRGDDVMRTGAIELGVGKARQALNVAFDKIKASRSAVDSSS